MDKRGQSTLTQLYRWQQGVSITLKALVLTVCVGVLFWVVLNAFQTTSQQKIFNDFLLEELNNRAQSDWGKFDDHMRAQMWVGKLLVDRHDFLTYIKQREAEGWAEDQTVVVKTEWAKQPVWLPARSTLRGLVRSTHLLLLDPKGRAREVFRNGWKPLPDTLLEGLMEDMDGVESRNTVRVAKGKPFILARVSLFDDQQQLRAGLVLVTTIDDEFLLNLQLQSRSEGVLVFLNQEGTAVVASSRPDLVSAGVTLKSLEQEYLVMQKSYFDHGFFSNYFIQYATLVSVSRIQGLSQKISDAGRTQRAVAHTIMVVLVTIIVYWLVNHIQNFTNEMLRVSQENLGLDPQRATGSNQLQVMKEQFRLLAHEISASRALEKERKEELKEANKALWKSLVMVKRTQAQLVESEKMAALGGLVAGVAHEINTPVGIGITAASFLQRRSKECGQRLASGALKKSELTTYFEETIESSEMILSNLNRAARHIRSFKQVAVDQTSEDRRCFNLKEYIDQVLLSLHHRLKSTRHTLSVVCPVDLEYDGFPGVLSQIITNFVENSLLHAFTEKESGEISIHVTLEGGNILFRYKDNGRGMSEQERKQVFEPFFTTARGRGGSGLGMHIVYNLVTQSLNGTVVCYSAPNEGVTFLLTIPASQEEQNSSEQGA
ncbi:MAG: HAMP domain-containing histidine kinase [Magnetococcales bacterium]|nr:HAMP domain-containing histidine kinase [Magnetococcales bacterium]